MSPNYLLLALFIKGLEGQSTTCEAVRQLTQGSFICSTPINCCTRIICDISIFVSDFQVNPCTSPPSISAFIEAGESVVFNRSGISTSQIVPLRYAGQGTDLNLLVNSTEEDITFAVSIGDTEVIPETTIPINSSQCTSASVLPSDSCFPNPVTSAPGPTLPTPSSIPTCLALQQVANRNFLGMTSNNCVVTGHCTMLTCTYLDQFPFSVTIVPCNSPPAVELVIFNNTKGGVLINETLSRSRTIPLELLGPHAALYITVEHPCGRSAIVIQVKLYIFFNATLIPRTEIPIDQSNCSTIGPSSIPCITPPPLPNTTCGALQRLSQFSLASCSITPSCLSVVCDLNTFSLPTFFNMTILPCLDVPGVNVFVINNGAVILNDTLTQSRMETVRVGPSNVTLNVTVLQSSDMSSIEVEVELVVLEPPATIPVFPLTHIPLDRCSCPQISCHSSTDAPTYTSSSQPISTTDATPTDAISQSADTNVATPSPISSDHRIVAPSPLTSDHKIVAPIVVAVVLFLALVVTIATAVVIGIVMKRRHDAYRKSFDNMSYGYVRAKDCNME